MQLPTDNAVIQQAEEPVAKDKSKKAGSSIRFQKPTTDSNASCLDYGKKAEVR